MFTVIPGDPYRSVFPAHLAEECGADHDTKADAWAWILRVRREENAFNWKLESPTECATELWKSLSDIPTNEDEEIDQDWLDFEKGTPREEIWVWFERSLNVSAAELMYGTE